jgi:hypothetical protein
LLLRLLEERQLLRVLTADSMEASDSSSSCQPKDLLYMDEFEYEVVQILDR